MGLITYNNFTYCSESRLFALEKKKHAPIVVVNKQNDLCLTSETGKNAFMSKCNGFASQLWFEQVDRNNAVVLTNRENGMVLNASDVDVNQRVYNGSPNQFFNVRKSAKFEKFFAMENKQNKLCIQANESNESLTQVSCKDNEEVQLFKFVRFRLQENQHLKVVPTGQLLVHPRTGLCLTKNNKSLKLAECQGDKQQLWFNEKKDGFFAISANHDGSYIRIDDEEATLSDKFGLFKENPSTLFEDGITIQDKESGLCLGNEQDDRYDVAIKSDKCGNGEEQVFRFYEISAFDYYGNTLFKGAKRFKFLMQWIYLKNEHTGTCMKFNGPNEPVTHEKCQNLKQYQWKIINISHRQFYIVTRNEKYVLAPKKNKLKKGVRIVAMKYDKDNVTAQEYIKIRAQSNLYTEFRLEYAASDLCFEYDKNGPIITQGECFCNIDGQLITPGIIEPEKPILTPVDPVPIPTPIPPTPCVAPMVREDKDDNTSPCVNPTIPPVKCTTTTTTTTTT